MDRRSFLDKMGKGTLTVAATTAGVGGTMHAAVASTVRSGTQAEVSGGDRKIHRFPRDLEKVTGDPALLKKPENLTVACYTFPNYSPTAIHNKIYAPGWTEYNLVRSARPWFEGHQQPRGPLLGELDENLPSTWEKYNRLASESGIDVFIWDWYWYQGEPALYEALENGFLRAENRGDMRFAIMWTNGGWNQLFPDLTTGGSIHFPRIYSGPESTLEECWKSMTYIISRYCHQPNYWHLNREPVIAVWDPASLIKNYGIPGTKKLLDELRSFAKQLGHKGLYFHVTGYGNNSDSVKFNTDIQDAGFNSRGAYNLTLYAADRYQPKDSPICDYEIACADIAEKMWPEGYSHSKLPYLPAVSIGWDTTPRYIMPKDWLHEPRTSHRMLVFKNESPAAFKALVQASFAYLNTHKELPPIVTIGCWNEWTEGQYLLPDNRFGYGMLDALAEALDLKATGYAHGG